MRECSSCKKLARIVAKELCAKCYRRDYNSKTVEKRKIVQREWDRKNPDRLRNIKLKSKYGITLADFNALRESQNGACAICLRLLPNLVVDHSHSTGSVRGLLCSRCNLLLGQAGDDPTILRLAAAYIQKFE